MKVDLYRYLNFDRISGFEDEGRVLLKEETDCQCLNFTVAMSITLRSCLLL
ncbi:aconitate hydratase 2 [Leptolyngbya sp. NIES-2104]|nr:aconitate hydratase 2 [Leptolyngbya sp. NIES-2104]